MEQISPLPITTASMPSTMQPSEAIQGKTCTKFFSRQYTNFFFIFYVNNTCNQFLIWFCYFMFETLFSNCIQILYSRKVSLLFLCILQMYIYLSLKQHKLFNKMMLFTFQKELCKLFNIETVAFTWILES